MTGSTGDPTSSNQASEQNSAVRRPGTYGGAARCGRHLPAHDESDTVTAVFAGLETDTRYQCTAEATSPAGATSFSDEFESIPPGAAPEGSKDKEVYAPPELPWANQSGNEAAERTVREQRKKNMKNRGRRKLPATPPKKQKPWSAVKKKQQHIEQQSTRR